DGVFQYIKQPQPPTTTIMAGGSNTKSYSFEIHNDVLYWFVWLPQGSYADGAFINNLTGSNYYVLQYDLAGNFNNATFLDIQDYLTFKEFYHNPHNGYYYTSIVKYDTPSTISINGQ